ncbi:HNH endonuclease [Halieaceae bacterium IMCC14734]|uniref:HNH endonuclease n=1 Tax=Candidatus Litorirhabdus singularis TaxID=2518993 RepID=A0ABT3TKU4_9GAMM|nr:HNH endonuclease [Candidatus Litorirhabdus singularis]MCX2982860.1 HNH endonuclease [Candidatus Litorirhabdus singularis]
MNFEQWLVAIGMSPKTAKSHSVAIAGGLSSWAAAADLVKQSLHEIDSVSDFRHTCEKLRRLEIYDARNTVGKGLYNAALHNYADYLAEITQSALEQDLSDIVADARLTNTEKTTLINTRVGQGKFRKQLIAHWGGCAVTGYADTRFLVASHIKPWVSASHPERLDPCNGLLLVPNLSKVFDLGYISFQSSGDICISEQLEDFQVLGIDSAMRVSLGDEHQDYLSFHRRTVFRR